MVYRSILVAGVLLLSAATALAQPGRGFGGGDQGVWLDRMLERMADRLELDDAQYDVFRQQAETLRPQFDAFGQAMQDLRAAAQDDDRARMQQIREEMRSLRAQGMPMETLLASIEPHLDSGQLEALNRVRDRMREQVRTWEQRERIRNLPTELGFDESQRAEFEELLDSRRAERREAMREMRPLWEELRAAREEGDFAREEELREQMRALRDSFRPDMGGLLDQVEGLLHEDQRAAFDALRADFGAFGRGPGAAAEEQVRLDVRTVLRAAQRVRLDSEQRTALRDIEREGRDAIAELRRNRERDENPIALRMKQQVEGLLDADQRVQFAEALERLTRRGGR